MTDTGQGFRMAPQSFAEAVPIDQMREHPANPNEGDVGAIDEALAVHGFYGAVGIQQSTGYLLWGNHRYRAAVARGATSLPGFVLDVDDDQAEELMANDNGTAAKARRDPAKLLALLQRRAESSRGLLGTSYTGDDMDDLVALLSGGPVFTPDGTDARHAETPEAAEARKAQVEQYADRKQGGALAELIVVMPLDDYQQAKALLAELLKAFEGAKLPGEVVLEALETMREQVLG